MKTKSILIVSSSWGRRLKVTTILKSISLFSPPPSLWRHESCDDAGVLPGIHASPPPLPTRNVPVCTACDRDGPLKRQIVWHICLFIWFANSGLWSQPCPLSASELCGGPFHLWVCPGQTGSSWGLWRGGGADGGEAFQVLNVLHFLGPCALSKCGSMSPF